MIRANHLAARTVGFVSNVYVYMLLKVTWMNGTLEGAAH